MGNILATPNGYEVKRSLSARRPRGHSTHSRRYSYSTVRPKGDVKSTSKQNAWKSNSSSDDNRGRTRRRHKGFNTLTNIDGNAHQAASAAWKAKADGRDRASRPRGGNNPAPQPSIRLHRYNKADPRHRSGGGSVDRRLQHQGFDRPENLRRGRHRNRNVAQKEKIVQIEVSEKGEQGRKKECTICTEARPLHHFSKRRPTAECIHEVNTCRRCLRKWIYQCFKTKLWDQISCPECSNRLQYADVQVFASSRVFHKYDELSTKVALEADPDFRWCLAKGCKSGQVHEQWRAMPRFKCVGCKASHCVVHEVPWHTGETCAEYDYRTDLTQKNAEEAASQKWIKQIAKKCPNCKRNIEKASGCDHMTCSRCKHEFCWQCLAAYRPIREQGNAMHQTSCEYYAAEQNRARRRV